MRLTALVYLLTFYGLAGAAPVDMIPKLSTWSDFVETIAWASLTRTRNDPDVTLNTLEMIRKEGYPAEAHVVTTEDGYRLTLHRIPGSNDSLPVLLQHGLLCTSADWVFLRRGKALAYLLADQGYDVWLGNFRGNTYSRAHISLSPSNSTFWDFSFNEMGIYDLPAMITYITNMRAQSLHTYIGHSMGAASFYIMASERPEIARMVQKMINFAPAVFINHMKSPLKYFNRTFILKLYEMIMRLFFHNEFLPQSNFLKYLTRYGCNQNTIEERICVNLLFMLCGYDQEQFNYALLPVILSHDPAGASSKTLLHYVQVYQTGKFRKYDYGLTNNLFIYNSPEPPDYNLARATVPVALFYGPGDWLVDVMDVKRLSHMLPNVIDMYEIPWPKFNHMDFLLAKDAPKLVYERMFELMKEKTSNNITSMEQYYIVNQTK